MKLEELYLHAQRLSDTNEEISPAYEMCVHVSQEHTALVRHSLEHPWAPGQWSFPSKPIRSATSSLLEWGREYGTAIRYEISRESEVNGQQFELSELHRAWMTGELVLPSYVTDTLWSKSKVRWINEDIGVLPLRSPTLPPATHTNCYLIGRENVLVIDPAATEKTEQQRLLDILKETGVRGVFLTHHHGDHVGTAELVASEFNVPIVAHPETARRVSFDVDTQWEQWVPTGWQGFHTPGHAPGHLCLFHEKSRFLVAGDMISSQSTIVIHPEEGNMAEYMTALQSLAVLAPRVVGPAHGDVIVGGQHALTRLLDHRRTRENKVVASLTHTPLELNELVKIVYDDVPSSLYGIAALSLRAHLDKLLAEGIASRKQQTWFLTSPG